MFLSFVSFFVRSQSPFLRPDPGSLTSSRAGAVKVWPGNGGACRKIGVAANLDRFCARRRKRSAGRDEETALRSNKETDEGQRFAALVNSLTKNAPYKACSGFTHVTARWIAQPPKATFVTRLQPFRLPGRAARQLPDQSTTLWVESSSTDDSRLRGALPTCDINRSTSVQGRSASTSHEISGCITSCALNRK